MTFNDKGFQPLMTLNSALARSIKGFSPLSFVVIHCHCTLSKLPNLLKLLNFTTVGKADTAIRLIANS